MIASAWVGLFAGLLPARVRGRGEIAMLAAYGLLAVFRLASHRAAFDAPVTFSSDLPVLSVKRDMR